MKWYIQAPWRIWSIQKNFVDVWVWKNARAHTQYVMWYEVMWCCVYIIPFLWYQSRFRRLHTCMFFRWKWIFFVAQSLVLIWLDRLQLFSSHHHIFRIIFAGVCWFLKPTIYITSMQKLRNFGHSVHISLSFFFGSLLLFELSVDLFKCIIFFLSSSVLFISISFLFDKKPKKKKNYRNKLNK